MSNDVIQQSDHDLLIRLDQSLKGMEIHILQALNTSDRKIENVLIELKKKVDIKVHEEDILKIEKKVDKNSARIEVLEKDNLVEDTKRGVYIGLAAFTWKHYVQLGTFLAILAAVFKAILQ